MSKQTEHYTIPSPDYAQAGEEAAPHRVQSFEAINARMVRQPTDVGGVSSTAWEITFRVPSGLQLGHDGIAAGMQIGLLPRNDDARVNRLISLLRGVPSQPVSANLPGRGTGALPPQSLTPQQVIAHTLDITRPTPQLYDLVAFERQTDALFDQPIGAFMQRLRAHAEGDKATAQLYSQLSSHLPQTDTQETARSVLQRLSDRGVIRFSACQDMLQQMGVEIERAEDCNLPVEEWLTHHPGQISFDQLVQNQPPLANRKYTPSEVNKQDGTLSILFSEVHAPDQADQSKQYAGTMTRQLTDIAHRLQQDPETPIAVDGYLDLRKHKLPYKQAQQEDAPMVLLSTGVGLAPHLAMLREANAEGYTPRVALFANGGRHAAEELCGDEVTHLLGEQAEAYQFVASAEAAEGQPRYVQDLLQLQHENVWQALNEQGGHVYMCGLQAMQEGAEQTLAGIARQHGMADGQAWVQQLKDSGRLHASTSAPDRFYKDKWPKEVARREAEQRVL